MCDVSLLKSRFDCLNGSQILKPLKKKKKKGVLANMHMFLYNNCMCQLRYYIFELSCRVETKFPITNCNIV